MQLLALAAHPIRWTAISVMCIWKREYTAGSNIYNIQTHTNPVRIIKKYHVASVNPVMAVRRYYEGIKINIKYVNCHIVFIRFIFVVVDDDDPPNWGYINTCARWTLNGFIEELEPTSTLRVGGRWFFGFRYHWMQTCRSFLFFFLDLSTEFGL